MNRRCFLVVAKAVKASKRFKVKYTYDIYAGGQYMTIDYTEFEFYTFSPNFVKSKFAYAECQRVRVYTSLDEDR